MRDYICDSSKETGKYIRRLEKFKSSPLCHVGPGKLPISEHQRSPFLDTHKPLVILLFPSFRSAVSCSSLSLMCVYIHVHEFSPAFLVSLSPQCSHSCKSQKRCISGPMLIMHLLSHICSNCFSGRANERRFLALKFSPSLYRSCASSPHSLLCLLPASLGLWFDPEDGAVHFSEASADIH